MRNDAFRDDLGYTLGPNDRLPAGSVRIVSFETYGNAVGGKKLELAGDDSVLGLDLLNGELKLTGDITARDGKLTQCEIPVYLVSFDAYNNRLVVTTDSDAVIPDANLTLSNV